MIFSIHLCGLSVSFLWRDIIVLHLDGLRSSIKKGVLHPLFVLFILLSLLQLIQEPLVTLGRLPGHNIEKFPPLFGSVFFSVLVISLVNFPL